MKEFEYIKRVNAPDYLWQKIEDEIAFEMENKVPIRWYWMAAACIVILIAVNIALLSINYSPNKNMEVYFESMQMNSTNHLYHE
jgi:hypothetical protein